MRLNMTWAEFKRWAEDHGVEDGDVILYIDIMSGRNTRVYRLPQGVGIE